MEWSNIIFYCSEKRFSALCWSNIKFAFWILPPWSQIGIRGPYIFQTIDFLFPFSFCKNIRLFQNLPKLTNKCRHPRRALYPTAVAEVTVMRYDGCRHGGG
jgi:hypothetical protein